MSSPDSLVLLVFELLVEDEEVELVVVCKVGFFCKVEFEDFLIKK